MKTHHADDETLEYIASLEQRNAELRYSLKVLTSTARYCSNRLDADGVQMQVSGDLAVAAAMGESALAKPRS
jgi:hypothetical protein